ncbi:Hpt domain-containing protein, partial [Desulfonatronospira sp. MSAO_Bac3]
MNQNKQKENEQMQQAFREEAGDILPELETTLLELEENPDDSELINRAFRALHTIKGSGAIFGFDQLSEFTHEIENAFDLVRSGKMQVSKRLLDLTLQAKDKIHALLYHPETVSRESLDQILKSIEEILPEQGSKSSEDPAQHVQEEDPQGETEVYHIRFKPERDIFATGTDPLMLVDELRELGPIFVAAHHEEIPDLESIDPEKCYVWWDILLASNMGRGAIDDVFIFVDEDSELSIEVLEHPGDAGEENLQTIWEKTFTPSDSSTLDAQNSPQPEKEPEHEQVYQEDEEEDKAREPEVEPETKAPPPPDPQEEKPAPPQAEQKEKSQARPQKTQPDKDKKPQDKQAAQAQTS